MKRFARTVWLPTILAIAIDLSISGFCASSEPSPTKGERSTSSNFDAEGRETRVENSVVKVFATVRYPDLYKPWTKLSPAEISGSGVVIEGKRILTSAHVVAYASQVQVQANQAGDKVAATVEVLGPGIDLAVLKVEDETFFDTHPPLPRARMLPAITDGVMVYGYPKGGASLSITKGIVSRIEFTSYNYPVAGLRIQIDAAINSGNSGGPAVANGKMIGLAFAHLSASENIGYIIPGEEIDLFLQDIADGNYDGKPGLFDEFQTLENATLRSFLKLDKSTQGMVIHKPDNTEPNYPLKEWDIITKIGDMKVDDQGMIRIDGLRIAFLYFVQRLAKDGKVPMTIVRAGKEIAVNVPVQYKRPHVIANLDGAYPSYFVYGPMVFSSASAEYVSGIMRSASGSLLAMGLLSSLGSPLINRMGDKPSFNGESLTIVSSPFFPHKLAKGYSNPASQVVKSINGIRIKNLKHLVEAIRDSKDEFITIQYDGRRGETMVFPRVEMAAATDEILTDNGIRSQASADILPVWNAKAGNQ